MKYLLFLFLFVFINPVFADSKHKHHEGEQGPKGDTGDTGPQGIQGVAGADGVQGIAGLSGVNGLNLTETRNYLDTQGYWTDNEITEVFAASTAMTGLDFDSTTNKLQLGLALGGYGGEENIAIGIGKVWDSDKVGDVLFSFKTTIRESGRDNDRPWVGSAIWKVNLP